MLSSSFFVQLEEFMTFSVIKVDSITQTSVDVIAVAELHCLRNESLSGVMLIFNYEVYFFIRSVIGSNLVKRFDSAKIMLL